MAEFLKRPELIDPVRKNLEGSLYLMHPGDELVTEISGRQDRNVVGSMGVNWLGLRYLAVKDGNGICAGLVRRHQAKHGALNQWALLPALHKDLPASEAVPSDYHRLFRSGGFARIRRGDASATILLDRKDRVFSLHKGGCVLNAVRFASAFFGKGQFVGESYRREGDAYVMEQRLRGPYYQPFADDTKVPSDPAVWAATRRRREQSEVAEMVQRCRVVETSRGFEVELTSQGTDKIPVAVELNFREDVRLDGVSVIPETSNRYLLASGTGRATVGRDTIRFGPGLGQHLYTEVRGARPKLPGPSVFLTGFTPFRHVLKFEW
jgi:hypothetical protein